MRGNVTMKSRSMKWNIRSPRKVTFAPRGWLARNLKLEMAFLERVMAGFWPLIIASSSTAMSKSLMLFSEAAFPTQTLITIFSTFGTCMTFLISNFFIKAGTPSFAYLSFRIVVISLFLIQDFTAFFADTGLLPAGQRLFPDPGGLPALGANNLQVGNMDGGLLFHNPALG